MKNEYGSAVPVLILFICLAVISFVVLIYGEILDPFFNIMRSGYVKSFLLMVWPNGLLLAFFIALSYALFMEYQKWKYTREGSGRS